MTFPSVEPLEARIAPASAISISDVSLNEGNSGTTDFTFHVTLDQADNANTITVHYATADGTGANPATTANSDYAGIADTILTFNPGETDKTITVQVNGDTVSEADEHFTVNLSTPDNATIAKTQGVGTILNDDSHISIGNVSHAEGNSGTTDFVFHVTLDNPNNAAPVTVHYSTADGTATVANNDYVAIPDTVLTFAAGETDKTVTVHVNGDTIIEQDVNFAVNLSNPANALIATAQGTGTILNDDHAKISIGNVSHAEGNAGTTDFVFHVTLDKADNSGAITVDYTTADGSGANAATIADNDYALNANTLTFAAGETDKTITVHVNGDTTAEQNEIFNVNLSNPSSHATITTAQGVGTILNDDAPHISIANASTPEGNSGTHNLTFTVTLAEPTTQTVGFHYATSDGTAISVATLTDATDYAESHGDLTIAAGATTKTFTVAINGDVVTEANETFSVDLSNLTNADLAQPGDSHATGTIVNDDSGTLVPVGNSFTTKQMTYTDDNGDLVTVTTSKGLLERQDFFFDSTGTQLLMLDISDNAASLAGANLTFTAVKQGANGDNHVNVGYIKAAGALGSIDLGVVKLPGDLGKIDVGDNNTAQAIKTLSVDSLGVKGTNAYTTDLVSNIQGGAGSISVLGDVNQAAFHFTDPSGKPGVGGIGVLNIGGKLIGGAAAHSGEVFFTGVIGKASVGGLVGGAGVESGTISGNFATLSKIKNLTITKNGVTGGSGQESGEIAASQIGSLVINGDVTGMAGNGSGLIQSAAFNHLTIKGSLFGGTGFNSGEIFSDKLGTVVVTGDVKGGTAGTASSAGHSGTIEANAVKSIKIGGSLIGGDFVDSTHAANFSGDIAVDGNIGSVAIGKNFTGGTGDSSGNLVLNGVLGKTTIGGNFTGGDSSASKKLINSGYVQAQRIPSFTIVGNFVAGSDGGAGIDTSGAIRAVNDIGTLTIKGDVIGKPSGGAGMIDNPAIVSAVGQFALSGKAKTDLAIKAVSILGNVTFADILAGYGTDTNVNLLGAPLNADASIGTVKIGKALTTTNIIAGAAAGTGGFFGDATDTRISGAGVNDRFDLISRISSVIIGGHATSSVATGIVAQNVVAVKANGVAVALTKGASNDLAPGHAIDGSANFHAEEIV